MQSLRLNCTISGSCFGSRQPRHNLFSVINPNNITFQSPAAVLWKGRRISLLMKLHDIGQGTKRRQTFSLMAILEKAVQHPAYHPEKSPIDPVI